MHSVRSPQLPGLLRSLLPRGRGVAPLPAAVLLVLAALAAAARAGAQDLLLASAVSLREPAQEIARRFEQREPGVRVRVALGASSTLAVQVRAGAPVDVFVSADERLVDELVEAGRVRRKDTAVVASNRLVVMGAPDRPPLADPEALVAEDVRRVALAAERVPVGRYARRWLAARGLAQRLTGREVIVEHARAALAAVDLGHVDLAIVYATDARAARRARVVYAIPQSEQPDIAYVAALATTDVPAARRLWRFLSSEEAGAVLARAGFGPPPDGGREP